MNEKADENFIYCTPFLDEIERICKTCGGTYKRFREPTYLDGTKIDSFNRLLSECRDIAVTHTTFLNATNETLELIRSGEYTLIVDEVLDVVESFNNIQSVEDTPRQKVTKDDVEFLLNHDIIQIREDCRVIWNDKEYSNELKFSEVERLAKLDRLYCVSNNFLVTVFPPEVFSYFKEIYILTYMFSGSLFKYYLDLFDIGYEVKTVNEVESRKILTAYSKEQDGIFREHCKELITICDNDRMNRYRRGTLTKTWYAGCGKEGLNTLKNNLNNYFKRYLKNAKASNGDIMWTCFKEYEDKLKGSGYIRSRNMTNDEKNLPKKEMDDLKKKLSCFVPCNARATNNYKDRWALAYCIDMRFHPMIRKMFTVRNEERINRGAEPINPDEDLYSLSSLIQWIFRSRIRENQPITIYIPSKRMRELFAAWMDNGI